MRKVVSATYITLDGVIENPMWTAPYFDGEASVIASGQMADADALLMGRRTYEGFSSAWPHMDESEDNGSAFMNNVKKYVASTTLTDPQWRNTEVLQGDLIEEVTALKAQDGKDILMYGYGTVTHALLKAGLLDVVRFWIHPVFVGGPTVSSPLAEAAATFDLIDTKVMKSGMIIASYQPKAG